jgi:hypothetical protein
MRSRFRPLGDVSSLPKLRGAQPARDPVAACHGDAESGGSERRTRDGPTDHVAAMRVPVKLFDLGDGGLVGELGVHDGSSVRH